MQNSSASGNFETGNLWTSSKSRIRASIYRLSSYRQAKVDWKPRCNLSLFRLRSLKMILGKHMKPSPLAGTSTCFASGYIKLHMPILAQVSCQIWLPNRNVSSACSHVLLPVTNRLAAGHQKSYGCLRKPQLQKVQVTVLRKHVEGVEN